MIYQVKAGLKVVQIGDTSPSTLCRLRKVQMKILNDGKSYDITLSYT